MLHRHLRLHCLDTSRRKSCKVCDPQILLMHVFQPVRVLPVNDTRQLFSGLTQIALPTARAVTGLREECHIEKHAFKVVHCIHLGQTVLHILTVSRIVRADDAVAPGFEIITSAVLTHIFAIRGNKPPFRMILICPVVENLGKISDDCNAVLMALFYHRPEEIESLQTLMHPADLCRIIGKPCVRTPLYHRCLYPGILQGVYIFININFAQKLFIPVIDVHIHQISSVITFNPHVSVLLFL